MPARGFTLIELMITITVSAILLAIAIPSFKHIMGTTKLGGVSNDLLADIKFARTQAVARSGDVAVASSSGGWASGWTVVASATSSGGSKSVLRVHDVIANTFTLDAGVASGDSGTKLAFSAQGTLKAPAKGVCFTITAPDKSHSDPVRLLVRPIGTVTQFKGGTGSSPTNCGS
ncbi:MAG: GspH/FimT family pseudopilin [Xanthomonadales bacterium]|nr:GspH/FimT family pseudopilin [Xanthomonadales bacterium]